MMGLRDKYGISFALTNVQGLSILTTCTQQTSFEFVKIPMYKTSDSGEEKGVDANELRELIDNARELGSLTIADKIDNANYLSTAIECGADFLSGYLVHPPRKIFLQKTKLLCNYAYASITPIHVILRNPRGSILPRRPRSPI